MSRHTPSATIRPFALATLLVALAPLSDSRADAQATGPLIPVAPPPGIAPQRPPAPPPPPPVNATEQRYRDLQAYIRARGSIDEGTKTDIARLAEQLDADLGAPTATREILQRLYPARAQVAIWMSDDAAMHAAFEKLHALAPDNDAVLIAWAREAIASADYERALEILNKRKIAAPRAVRSSILKAQALIGIHRFFDAQASLNSAPMERTSEEFAEIGALSARITSLNDLWSRELSAISRDQNGEPLPTVELLTSKGPILVELFEEDAPFTVRNFIERTESGTYDGTVFHRFQRGFGIQGGDPESAGGGQAGRGTGGWLIPDENEPGKCRLPLFGRLVMAKQTLPGNANKPAPNTAGCQFTILFSNAESLQDTYAVFGRVVDGWEIARELVAGDQIVQARVTQKRAHAYEAVRLPDRPGAYLLPKPIASTPVAAPPGPAPVIPKSIAPEVSPTPVPATKP